MDRAVWNDVRVSKLWQNFHFWVNYPIMDVMVFANTDPNGNDVARAVDHRQPSVQQQLSHVFDVSLMGSAQSLAFWALQHTHRFQSPRQHHGRQGGSEDETGSVGAHSVHQGGSAGYVTTHTAKCFTYRYFKQYQQSWEARTDENTGQNHALDIDCICLTQSSRDNIDLVHDIVSLSYTCSVSPIQSDSMDLIHKSQCSIFMCYVT